MSKVLTIAANATYTVPVELTIKNTYVATDEEISALAELDLPLKASDVWNTGLAAVGNPHIDEIARGVGDEAIVTDGNTWVAKHIASFRLFRTNSFVYLLPGDEITVAAQTPEEAYYYGTLKGDFLEVTVNPVVTEGADREDEGAHPAAQLDRTTGIGDYDDGDDSNGVYPFQFNTEDATNGELGDDHFTVTVTDGTADPARGLEGVTVTLTAGTVQGKTFSEWTVTSPDGLTLDDATASTTTFTMPASDVVVVANFV